MNQEHSNCVAIIAHPDDETLWAGGTLLLHPDRCWTVATVTRKSDRERAAKFHQTLVKLMIDMRWKSGLKSVSSARPKIKSKH